MFSIVEDSPAKYAVSCSNISYSSNEFALVSGFVVSIVW